MAKTTHPQAPGVTPPGQVPRPPLRWRQQQLITAALVPAAVRRGAAALAAAGRQLVAPNEFTRIAEDTGLIEGIGTWVLNEVAAQIRTWRQAGLQAVPVGMNLSARQLHQAGAFAAQVRQVLAAHGLEGGDLVKEITESMLLDLGGEAEAALRQLAHHGITLALDDFGTGCSSLSTLARLPVDTQKIDRSFVRGMMERDTERKLVRALIELGHVLDMRVTAEGVETAEQHAPLMSMRADALQGHLFCQARPAAEFGTRYLQAEQALTAP